VPGNCIGPGNPPPGNAAAGLAQLRSQLRLAPNQEPAWSAYAAKVQAQADNVNAMRQVRPGASMNPSQRQAFHDSMMKQRAAENGEIAKAGQALEAVLNPAQRSAFDAACPPPGVRPGAPGRRW
jgi:hypothetical protein